MQLDLVEAGAQRAPCGGDESIANAFEIGLRRLEARPTADLCFDCKELAEKKEKQVGKA